MNEPVIRPFSSFSTDFASLILTILTFSICSRWCYHSAWITTLMKKTGDVLKNCKATLWRIASNSFGIFTYRWPLKSHTSAPFQSSSLPDYSTQIKRVTNFFWGFYLRLCSIKLKAIDKALRVSSGISHSGSNSLPRLWHEISTQLPSNGTMRHEMSLSASFSQPRNNSSRSNSSTKPQ